MFRLCIWNTKEGKITYSGLKSIYFEQYNAYIRCVKAMNLSYLKHPNSLYLDTTLIKLQDFSCIVKFSELFYLIFLFLFHFAEA